MAVGYFHGYTSTLADAVEYADGYLAKLLALNFEYYMDEEPASFADTIETVDEDNNPIAEEDKYAEIEMTYDLNADGTRYLYTDMMISYDDDRSADEGQWKIWFVFELFDGNLLDL